jgi:hypothetical protein
MMYLYECDAVNNARKVRPGIIHGGIAMYPIYACGTMVLNVIK